MITPVVNPDESLAELYHRRRDAKNALTKSKHNLAGANTEYEYTKKTLAEIESKIAVVEKAMTTYGKQVRLF